MRADRAGAVTAASGAALMLAMLSFAPVVQGSLWWWRSLLLVVVVLAVAALARRAGLTTAAVAMLATAAVLPVATLLTLGPATVLDLGARGSASALLDVSAQGFRQIALDSVPAQGTPELALVMGVGAALVAIVVDAVAVGLGAPIAGMLVVLAVAIVPGKAFATGTNGWVLLAVAASALLVVAADRRRRGAPPRIRGLAAGGAIAVVLTLVAQVVLPAPQASIAAGPAAPLFGTNVDPLVRLGENLRRGATTDVLTYRTSGPDKDVYLRLAVLEDFSGDVWQPNPADGRPLRSSEPPDPAGLSANAYAGTRTTVITPATAEAVGERLPLPYPATAVSGLGGADFRWEDRGLTLIRNGGDRVGPYTVESAVVDATPEELRRSSTTAPAGDQQSTALPARVPAIITSTARAWTADAGTAYDQALAIQNRLRSAPFAYDETTPAERGYDGDGLGVIATFLRVKAGYCIHYASTMAVMARVLGIPSRIVVGYQPGDAEGSGASRTVTTDDLHAWPELYFDGVGWVRFEPTPGQGAVPAYAPPPTASASAEASASAPVQEQPTTAPSTAAGPASGGGVALAVVAVLSVPALLRLRRRRRRLAAGTGGGATGGWRELI
ncbi:transglutaminaseTgpA domain-containing protein, partial [Amnibacterium endophyticum]